MCLNKYGRAGAEMFLQYSCTFNGTYITVTHGDTFTYLTVDYMFKKNDKGKVYAHCICKCGAERDVLLRSLLSGNTKSCGCYNKELTVARNYKHGHKTRNANTERLYNCWLDMHKRCYNVNSKSYNNYGGRGISVCDAWHDYLVFKNWAINNGYSDDLTLERINVNVGYCPDNCTWISKSEQSKNRNYCTYLTYNNKTMTLTEWARELGMSRSTLLSRYNRHPDWSTEKLFEGYI